MAVALTPAATNAVAVRVDADGKRFITLPTEHPVNRALMQFFSVNVRSLFSCCCLSVLTSYRLMSSVLLTLPRSILRSS